MARCLISFGANLGQPAETIREAAALLQSVLAGGLVDFRLSRFFRTPAVGGPTGQPPFINAVAALQAQHITAWDVWHAVRRVEQELGRVRIERWEARRIDLDVLLFDSQLIWTPHFKLPHPRMVMRRFILEPALDVAADWIEPVSGWTLSQLATALRHGAASIAIVSHQRSLAQRVMELSAANSQARWLNLELMTNPRELEVPRHLPADQQRWLGLVEQARLEACDSAQLEPPAKMVVVLADALTTTGAAWEDVHRPLAEWLGMCARQSNPQRLAAERELPRAHPNHEAYPPALTGRWPLEGPRYLLATDDLKWTEHEIVAALEAMDCPVEPLPVS